MKRRIGHVAKLFVWLTGVALVIRFFFLGSFFVSSSSMLPRLLEGDYVLASKFDFSIRLPMTSYELLKTGQPRRGDVVVFTLPERGEEVFIKRVVAVPGEELAINNGVLLVDGREATYEPVEPGSGAGARLLASSRFRVMREDMGDGKRHLVVRDPASSAKFGPVTVPADHYFVLNDNRADQSDSRILGPVPHSSLVGRARIVWFSRGSKEPVSGAESLGLNQSSR